jgi:hypothetical protein
MSRLSDLPPNVLDTLSAALDGALDSKEQATLQARLRDDEGLRLALQELRQVRAGLGMLPRLRAPRNFTLTPEMVGRRAARPAYPRLRLATALAALAFALTFGLDTLLPRVAAMPMALRAAAPAVGTGAEAPPEAAAEMMLESAVVVEATAVPGEMSADAEPSAADSFAAATATQLPTSEPALKAAPAEEESAPAPAAPPAAAQESVVEPTATPEVAAELQDLGRNEADALEPLGQTSPTQAERRTAARPLQLAAIALGALTLLLGTLAVRARRLG